MSLAQSIKHYKSKLEHKIFDIQLREVLTLPPLKREKKEAELCVLSMLCKRDFIQYLLSIYSFVQFIQPTKIVIVNDGSLTEWQLNLLKTKIPDIEILIGTDYIDERLPTYTSWRRMLALESYVANYYVIQLDADIISQHNLNEVYDAYRQNRSFILGTEQGQLISADEAKSIALSRYKPTDKHVQQLAENNMDIIKEIGFNKYYRGCAGFAGYAKGSFSKETLVDISSCMFKRIGDTWRNWGSEQVCANILLANQKNSIQLPLENYDSVQRFNTKLKLIHFIGSIRFKDGLYAKLAHKTFKAMKQNLCA